MRSGLVMAWRFATWPTMRSPVFENATTDGVVREPSAFAITTGSPPSMTATQELVVPKSIPIVLAIKHSSKIMIVVIMYQKPDAPVCRRRSVCNLDHSVAHHAVVQHEAGLEHLRDHIFPERFIVHMHHGVVQRGIERFPHLADFLHAHAV